MTEMSSEQNKSTDSVTENKNTELRFIEEELKHNNNFIRTITDNIPGMIGYWTSDLKCAFANQHYLTWFGRTMEQMRGIRMQDLLGDKLFQANQPYIRGALNGEEQKFERTIIKPNGDISHTYAQYIPDIVEGKVKGFHAIILDMTELKRGQESLLDSEQRYRGLLVNLDAAVVVHAPDTSIIMHNDRAAELLGLNRDKIIGRLVTDPEWNFVDENNSPLPIEEFPAKKIKDTKQPIRNKIYGIKHRSTNDIVWVSVNGFPSLNKNGDTSEIVVSFIDITAHKKAEQALQQRTQELETLNATKDKFFSIIAHDLRNPFAGIKALSEIIEAKFRKDNREDESRFLDYCQMIISSSKSALSLINNLTQWAQSQTGEITVDYQNISLNSLLSHTIPIVKGSAINKNITLEQSLSSQDSVYADQSLLSTILRNLLTNAIKFTPRNGKIIVSTENKNGSLEISISDTGVGIEPENLEKIFRIGSNFTKLGTDNESGTGLGLILCKEFVEMQDGKIWVTSEVGVGSTFTFTLPLA
jgi:PAS domain S-box-containing protein